MAQFQPTIGEDDGPGGPRNFLVPYPQDLLIRNKANTAWLGQEVYSTDGTGESLAKYVKTGLTTSYQVRLLRGATGTLSRVTLDPIDGDPPIDNGNYTPAATWIKGASAGNGWTVKYYDLSTNPPTEVTAAVTSAQGWYLPASTTEVSPRPTVDLRVDVTPNLSPGQGVAAVQSVLVQVDPTTAPNYTEPDGNFGPDAVLATTTQVSGEEPPTVSITVPAATSIVSSLAQISGTASGVAGVERVDVYLAQADGANWLVWDAVNGQWWPNVGPPLPTSAETSWVRNTGLPSGFALPQGNYRVSAVAYDELGSASTPAVHDFQVVNGLAVGWSSSTPISCGGIQWPTAGRTIAPGEAGTLSSFLATDFDQQNLLVSGTLVSKMLSDPCSYTWSATGGTFVGGRNSGQSVKWIAPTTPGTYTIALVVDDQNQANQKPTDLGGRGDTALSYNDDPLKFSATVTVVP